MKITAEEIANRSVAVDGPRSLPVTFIDRSGSPTTDVVLGSPCIRLTAWYRRDLTSPGEASSREVWALLDTGADFCYADAALIEALGSPALREIQANAEQETVHQIAFRIDGRDIPFQVASRPLRRHGNGFDIILGRQFLRYGVFSFDIREGKAPRFHLSVEA